MKTVLAACVMCLLSQAPVIQSVDIVQAMEGKSVDLFRQLLQKTDWFEAFLRTELTIFAPSDDAMRKYNGKKDDKFLLNHIVNVVVKVNPESSSSGILRVNSLLQGNPPLYITRRRSEYFVNGAKIIMRNLIANSNIGGRGQHLHIIDRVLEPLAPKDKDDSDALINLSAGKFMGDSNNYILGGFGIRNFTAQVRLKKKMHLFEKPGQHTFFVPVDKAFTEMSADLIDEDVIPGHVIPDKLLFSRPIQPLEEKTATYTDSDSTIKVTAVIQSDNDGAVVKSHTVTGNRRHARSHVIARIVKANIPVANGIMHLIDRPLIVVASPLWSYLEKEHNDGGRLSQFAKYMMKYAAESGLKDKIVNGKHGTLFAPADEAFEFMSESEMDQLMQENGAEILGMHYLGNTVPSEDVRIFNPQNDIKMFHSPLVHPEGTSDELWFYYTEDNSTLVVNGLGVHAEVVERDIGATNGIIHVINKVLGVPDGTVYDTLGKDPMVKKSFTLGIQDHFNDQFKDASESFTYLVPSDDAWEKINSDHATAYKVLFMGDFFYQTRQILERHFKIGEGMSTQQLIEKSELENGVQMYRGRIPLKFREVEEEDGTFTVVEWEDIVARIIRPNLKCNNGYIHIIDKVIMKRRDVSVAGATKTMASTIFAVLTALVAKFLC